MTGTGQSSSSRGSRMSEGWTSPRASRSSRSRGAPARERVAVGRQHHDPRGRVAADRRERAVSACTMASSERVRRSAGVVRARARRHAVGWWSRRTTAPLRGERLPAPRCTAGCCDQHRAGDVGAEPQRVGQRHAAARRAPTARRRRSASGSRRRSVRDGAAQPRARVHRARRPRRRARPPAPARRSALCADSVQCRATCGAMRSVMTGQMMAGTRPQSSSGSAKVARSVATIQSQAQARPRPPPMARPSTTARSGFGA